MHPINNNIIYISTGARVNGMLKYFEGYSLGIFKTTDGGNTWTQCYVATNVSEYFNRIMIDPENPQIIYALSDADLYKSVNGGSYWTSREVQLNSGQRLTDMEFKTSDSDVIYLCGLNTLLRSDNGGNTFVSIKDNINYSTSSDIMFDLDVKDDDFYIAYNSGSYNDVEKSTDDGENWSAFNINPFNLTFYGDFINIKISPNNDIYCAGVSLYKSIDGGQNFSKIMGQYIHVDFLDIYFPDDSDNNLVYVVNDGGVYMDDSGGSSWDRINGDLVTNEFYDIAITEEDPEYMVGGTHDCGTYLRNSAGDWSFVRPGDGGKSIIDHSNKNIYYASSTEYLYRIEPNKTDKKIADLETYNSPFAMHPTNSNMLFMQSWEVSTPPVQILKSVDKGDNWSTIDYTWDDMRDFEISKSNPDIMYYTIWDPWPSSLARIRKSINGGALNTWSDVSYSGIDSDVRQAAPINDIWVSRTDPDFVIIAFGGFEGGHIYYSTNGGQGWTQYAPGLGSIQLPDVPIQCINYDETFDKLFVGTDVGLFYWDKYVNGHYWYLETDIPQTIISDIEINETSGEVVVSTYGRGVWRAELEHFCDEPTWQLTSYYNFTGEMGVCPDLDIYGLGHLYNSGKITMSRYSSITVRDDGELTVTQNGELLNANVTVEDGGSVTINSNGKVYLNEGDIFQIDLGATANIEYGSIEPN